LRNQKVVEVAPARMHPELRRRITDCAVRLVQNCEYRGVGTVEFMVAGELSDPDASTGAWAPWSSWSPGS